MLSRYAFLGIAFTGLVGPALALEVPQAAPGQPATVSPEASTSKPAAHRARKPVRKRAAAKAHAPGGLTLPEGAEALPVPTGATTAAPGAEPQQAVTAAPEQEVAQPAPAKRSPRHSARHAALPPLPVPRPAELTAITVQPSVQQAAQPEPAAVPAETAAAQAEDPYAGLSPQLRRAAEARDARQALLAASRHQGQHYPRTHPELDAMIARHARVNNVPEDLVHRIVIRESRYNPRAVGRGGALGLMQIKHGTARALGYSGPASGLLDANTNLTYAVRYLAGAYRTANGNFDRAVGYYARGYYYAAKRMGTNPAAVKEAPPETATASASSGFQLPPFLSAFAPSTPAAPAQPTATTAEQVTR